MIQLKKINCGNIFHITSSNKFKNKYAIACLTTVSDIKIYNFNYWFDGHVILILSNISLLTRFGDYVDNLFIKNLYISNDSALKSALLHVA